MNNSEYVKCSECQNLRFMCIGKDGACINNINDVNKAIKCHFYKSNINSLKNENSELKHQREAMADKIKYLEKVNSYLKDIICKQNVYIEQLEVIIGEYEE